MSRPSLAKAAFVIEDGKGYGKDVRGARVGKGPLIELWVSEYEGGARGMILDHPNLTALIEALNDLADEIESEFPELAPADEAE